ncbi:MAG: FliM/FliN family flagellar motor switch protein, partial [Geminicoccaceae bacterium]
MESMTARRLQVRAVGNGLPTVPHDEGLGLSVTPSSGRPFSALLYADDEQLGQLSIMLQTHLGRARHPWPYLPVPMTCRLATMQVTSGELRQVKEGDLLLVSNMIINGQVDIVVGSDFVIRGKLSGTTVEVVEERLRVMEQDEQEETA